VIVTYCFYCLIFWPGIAGILLTRVAREKALPFEPLVPNTATIEAMTEARRGDLSSFATVEELMAELNADD